MIKQRVINFFKAFVRKRKDTDELKKLVIEMLKLQDECAVKKLDFEDAFTKARFLGVEAPHDVWSIAVNTMNLSRIELGICQAALKDTQDKIQKLLDK